MGPLPWKLTLFCAGVRNSPIFAGHVSLAPGWSANASFHGGFGLVNPFGVPKPSYRAYQLLHQAGNFSQPVTRTSPPPPAAPAPAAAAAGIGGGEAADLCAVTTGVIATATATTTRGGGRSSEKADDKD